MKSQEKCETVYDIFIDMMKSHSRIRKVSGHNMGYTDNLVFDLENKTVHNGVISFIVNGQLVCDSIETTDGVIYEFAGKPFINPVENFYEILEELYTNFKYSVPTNKDNICRHNFKAKHSDELSFKQLMDGEKRTISRCKLEAYVTLMASAGFIPWKNDSHFFWQSERDSDLILFKEWCL